jgi:urease accessory protein
VTAAQPTASASIHASQNGLAKLRFEFRDGRTRLAQLRTRSPLTVQRALYPDDRRPDMAHVILANPTAGLLAGDSHEIDVRVASGARARVTTQAATKVFSMPRGQAEQTLTLMVQEAGLLEYLPRSLIPFRSSSLQQRVTIRVSDGGTIIYGDVLSLGRVHSGERLAFRSLSLNLSAGRPSGTELYIEAYRLDSQDGSLDMTGIIGGDAMAAVGTLIVVTNQAEPDDLAVSLRDHVAHHTAHIGVAALPGGGGVVLKALGPSAAELEALLDDAASACG